MSVALVGRSTREASLAVVAAGNTALFSRSLLSAALEFTLAGESSPLLVGLVRTAALNPSLSGDTATQAGIATSATLALTLRTASRLLRDTTPQPDVAFVAISPDGSASFVDITPSGDVTFRPISWSGLNG